MPEGFDVVLSTAVLLLWGIPVVYFDLTRHRIPNFLTYSGMFAGLLIFLLFRRDQLTDFPVAFLIGFGALLSMPVCYERRTHVCAKLLSEINPVLFVRVLGLFGTLASLAFAGSALACDDSKMSDIAKQASAEPKEATVAVAPEAAKPSAAKTTKPATAPAASKPDKVATAPAPTAESTVRSRFSA